MKIVLRQARLTTLLRPGRGRALCSLLVMLALISADFPVLILAQSSAPRQTTNAVNSDIDGQINQRLDKQAVKPSPVCDDAAFIRRVYLDIVGVIPPVEKVKAFLDSAEPNKRSKLIDDLLADPRFGRHLAEIWEGMLLPNNSDTRRFKREPLRDWLANGFNANKPWDRMATELITATGDQDKNGTTTFFIINDTPDKVTDTVTRLFLGVQLQCAQCHNHPFTSWKQDEYWGMAAFFKKVSLTAQPKMALKNGTPIGVTESGTKKGKKKMPNTAKNVPPKFLQGIQPRLNPAQPYRPVLASWMTSPQNPFFARAMVNRTWAHFFGRGIVNPVDDMHDGNPASHPELLAALTEQFKISGYDVKQLIRTICNSQAYQRSSQAYGGNDEDTELFSHMAIRSMTPEQLFDSLAAVVGERMRGGGPAAKKKAGGKAGPKGPRDQFVAFFRTEENPDPTEFQGGIPQALRLMNSQQTNVASAELLNQAMKAGKTPAQIIEQLSLGTLARRPSAQEVQRLTTYVSRAPGQARTAYGDILWAILNSSEFTLNH